MADTTAIPGTRRQFRELVDGTIRVQIDVDPPYRKAFFEAFGEIDMGVCIVPMASTAPAPEQYPEPPDPIGPRCKLAVMWCKDPQFQGWFLGVLGRPDDQTRDLEAEVAAEVRHACGIESRRELDEKPEAGVAFDQFIRRPYQAFLREFGQ